MMRIKVETTQTAHPITSPYGNTLPLCDALGRLSPDAPLIAHAFMFFPDNPVTAWTFVESLRLVSNGSGMDDYPEAPRSVCKWFISSINQSVRQIQLAAMVGSALLVGSADKKIISFRKAIHIVQRKIDESPSLGDGRMPRDEKNIRDAFNRFSPSIHMLLAMISMHQDKWDQVDRNEQSLRAFLSASANIQAILAARSTISDWRPWVIEPKFLDPNTIIEIDGLSALALRYAEEYRANPDRL